ncbi:MAG: TRAP transporter small permease [Gammaproteobacteria bacterium]|nr:TRAP transporter small permease [Gammaproteobacteria bacterium]
MLLLSGIQILMRNLFDSGLIWSDPLLKLLVLWAAMLGAMVATRERNHINIDVLSRLLGPSARHLQYIFVQLISAAVSLLLAYQSARFVHYEYLDGTQAFSFAAFPAWITELILPLGFGLMGLRFLTQAFRPAKKVLTEDKQA